MAINRLFVGNDMDLIVRPFADASTAAALNDADLFATVCHAERTGLIAAATNASPIVMTSFSHGLQTGDFVATVGIGGNTAARGTFEVTRVNDDQFSLNGSAGNGLFTQGGRWYLALADADAREIPLELVGTGHYLGVLPGTVGLVEGGRYAVVSYATGEYRDRYNQVDQATAVIRAGGS